MIYFIADFGYFGNNDNHIILEQNCQQLKKAIEKNDTKSILLLGGDNFYPRGIENDDDIKLELFRDMFNFLPKDNIFGVLGNHDYGGQIKYQLTNPYFTCKKNFYIVNDGTIDYYMIDTTNIDYLSYTSILNVYENIFPEDNDDFHRVHQERIINDDNYNAILTWQNFKKQMESDLFENRRRLLEELDKSFEKSIENNKTIILVGHYPLQTFGSYYSINENCILMKHLAPLILKHNINFYISGHDHNNQHIYYTRDEIENNLSTVQHMNPNDDIIFINKILKEYSTIKKQNTKYEKENGLHMYICGSFIDTYYGYYKTIEDIRHFQAIVNVIFFNSDKQSYLTIKNEDQFKSILFSFVDIKTNKEYYSCRHNF